MTYVRDAQLLFRAPSALPLMSPHTAKRPQLHRTGLWLQVFRTRHSHELILGSHASAVDKSPRGLLYLLSALLTLRSLHQTFYARLYVHALEEGSL